MGEVLAIVLDIFQVLGLALLLFVLPGWSLLGWLWRSQELAWGEQVGLAASLSLAIWPLVLLWCYQLGLRAGPLVAWLIAAFGLAGWLWLNWGRWRLRQFWAKPTWASAPDLAYLVLIGALVATRLLPICTMVAPAWGDSVHHTLIVQLLLDHGGLFQSWEPYVPLATFSYHFGFHAAMAGWAWLSGMEAAQAVLIGAQVVNILAILALYPIAVRLAGGNRWAGVVAVLAAGLLFQMPAYYVNWGRYTQLAGQAILPGLLWSFDRWWGVQEKPSQRLLLVITLLGAGLALTHYRMAVIGAAAGVAWAVWSLWAHRRQGQVWLQRALWLLGAGLVSGLLVLPWVLIVQSTRLPYVAGSMAQQGANVELAAGDLIAWGSVDGYYTRLGWVGALLALGLALVRRPQVALPLLLWGLFTFLATNPYLIGLPGAGLVNNFTLVIGAYLPLALVWGWLIAELGNVPLPVAPVRPMALLLFALLLVYGVRQQVEIVDPAFQLVTPADEAALAWVKQNTPPNAEFLVNGFLAYGDRVVVGSDAGWWLPYYTGRKTTVPPIVYTVEFFAPGHDREALRQLLIDLHNSNGDAAELQERLCDAGITHLYLGDRQGGVGFEAAPLIPVGWLLENPTFRLLHQAGQAQVWSFARESCVLP